ncbi:coadhesin-like [Bolinopsis microptera]|uniref:coadhesin-like n=1 Tax=Bolinopsis microptera TaxID=2820187 RepID=UPI00307A531D
MRCTLLLLVLSLALFSSAEASRVRDGCKSSIKKYGKCLKKGFVSNLGCKYNSKKTLKGKKNKKCKKIETTAKDCGMSCAMAAIDGGWSDFGDWSECDAVCGGGSQERKRTCTNPAPENSGSECQGDDSENQDCNTQGCPVDGGWSDFGDWSECDAVCGGGSQEKKRTCTNPAPENGGAECQGDDSENQDCNTQGCPIDGGWSDFGDWSECDAVCGGGSQEKKRTCTNPAPENGGAECQGDDSENLDCNTQGCPIDGGWSDFGDWSECDAVCGGGSQEKKRTCTNPAPENGGAECQGDDSESQDCNTQGCPPAQLKFVSAVQDSTNHGGVANRAFDGNTAGAWPSK